MDCFIRGAEAIVFILRVAAFLLAEGNRGREDVEAGIFGVRVYIPVDIGTQEYPARPPLQQTFNINMPNETRIRLKSGILDAVVIKAPDKVRPIVMAILLSLLYYSKAKQA